MRAGLTIAAFLMLAKPASGAERVFDFGEVSPGTTPPQFKSFVAGSGGPGDWQVMLDEAPTELPAISPQANPINRRAVLAQLSREKIDERFPITYFTGESFGEFTFSTKFKLLGGTGEQIAGVVFRLQDERNYYVARANGLDGNVRFYKFVNGERTAPVGNDLPVTKGVWHELSVECAGNQIQIRIDGRPAMPAFTDNSFATGKVGFITKSDAVSYFADAKVVYRPLVSLAEKVLKSVLEDQARLVNLKIYGRQSGSSQLTVLAAKSSKDVGAAASDVEAKVLAENQLYLGKSKTEFIVTAPIRDRNGDAMGVAKMFLKRFTGQTEGNAVARAEQILKHIQTQVGAALSLTED